MHRIHRTSCREEPPTDGTDEHRCRRVWHPCHTHADKFCVFCEFCGRTAHPKYLCKSVKSVGGKIFPQNARNSQNLLQRKDSHGWHRCSQMYEEGVSNSVGEQHTLSICVNLLSMLKSKCFDHYFHFKLRFYILGYKAGGF